MTHGRPFRGLQGDVGPSTPAPATPPPRGHGTGLGAPGPTSCHEAGHAVVGAALGHPPELVTLGATRSAPRTVAGREAIEAEIVGLLAGAQAELLAIRSGGYRRESRSEVEAQRLAARLAARGRHRELLDWAAESLPDAVAALPPTVRGTDEAEALELSESLAGTEAQAHLAWLGAVAARMVRDLWPAIVAVALALEERGSLSGAECVAIMEAAGIPPASARETQDR